MTDDLTQGDLPNFRSPPVTEVALAVQFEPVDIPVVALGSISEAFGSEFPVVQEQPRRPPMTVDGGPQFSFELRDGFEKPNLQLVSRGGDRMVQFQSDRLVVNWRRRPNEDYPRYDHTVRPMFVDAWQRLSSVLEQLSLGTLQPNVCEVVYVNLIEKGRTWQGSGDEQAVLAPWTGRYSDGFLPAASELRLGARYPLPEGAGWLNVESNPIRRTDTGDTALLLQLSSRGIAKSPNLDGALHVLDLGREWIVKGFVSFTESDMHDEWGIE